MGLRLLSIIIVGCLLTSSFGVSSLNAFKNRNIKERSASFWNFIPDCMCTYYENCYAEYTQWLVHLSVNPTLNILKITLECQFAKFYPLYKVSIAKTTYNLQSICNLWRVGRSFFFMLSMILINDNSLRGLRRFVTPLLS